MGILRKLPFLLRLYIGRQNSTLILVEMGKFVLLEIIEAGLSSAVFRSRRISMKVSNVVGGCRNNANCMVKS